MKPLLAAWYSDWHMVWERDDPFTTTDGSKAFLDRGTGEVIGQWNRTWGVPTQGLPSCSRVPTWWKSRVGRFACRQPRARRSRRACGPLGPASELR